MTTRFTRRDLGYMLLGAGATGVAAACAPEIKRTAEAQEFLVKLSKHSHLFYNPQTGNIEINTDGLEFKMPGRALDSERVEVGYLNNTSLALKDGDRTYEEWSPRERISGMPHTFIRAGQKPIPVRTLDQDLANEVTTGYNSALSRLSHFIDQRVNQIVK